LSGKDHGAEGADHAAGRTAVLTTQALLRQSMKARWSNARQKVAFVLLTLLIAVGGAFVARYVTTPKALRFVTGPKGTAEYVFAEKLAAATAQNRRLRVVVQPQESPAAAAALFAQNRADLAIVRGDTKIPPRARAVAILERSLLLVGAPKAAKPKSLAALKGKRLAQIGDDQRDTALVRQILSFYDAAPAGPLELHNFEEWPRLFDSNGPAAVFYMIRKSEIASDKFLPNRVQKPNFELIDLDSKALAARLRGVGDDTIDSGFIVPSPAIPSGDIDTLSVEDTLICQTRLSEALGTELAGAVFENKDQLGEAGRYAVSIEPPSTDKDAKILAHPGVAEYVDDETKTFFDRYSDMIYIGMSVASIVGSVFLGLYSTVTRISPVRAGQLTNEVLALGDRATEAESLEEICRLEKQLNRLLAEVLNGIRDGTIASEGFEAFRLTFDLAREALDTQRDVLTAQRARPDAAAAAPATDRAGPVRA
jgi:TRAP-type uncharacterized transport system substrate-binding protein